MPKLSDAEYARFKELKAKKDRTDQETAELEALTAKRNSKESDQLPSFKPGNALEWWSKYAELLADAANIAANWVAGTPLYNDPISGNVIKVPGAYRISVLNTVGSEDQSTDPFNMEVRNIYLLMFQKYRGISAYQASDLGMVIIAGIEVVSLIAKLERIYGVINYYKVNNINIPTTIVRALGLTVTQADIIRSRLSDYRYDLNMLIEMCTKVLVPRNMSVLANKLSLYGYIYKDHEDDKAQAVVFDYDHYGLIDETSLTTGTSVGFQHYDLIASGSSGVIDLTANHELGTTMFPLLKRMIDLIVKSDSIQKIMGDLLAYFGRDQFTDFFKLPYDYKVEPIYSEEIMHKIHNMEFPLWHSGNTAIDKHVKVATIINTTSVAAADVTLLKTQLTTTPTDEYSSYVYYQGDNVIYTKLGIYAPSTNGAPWANTTQNQAVPISDVYRDWVKLLKSCHVLDAYRETFDSKIIVEGVIWKPCIRTSYVQPSNVNVRGYIFSSNMFEIPFDCKCYTLDDFDVVREDDVFGAGQGIQYYTLKYLSFMDWAPIYYELETDNTVPYYVHCTGISGDICNARPLDNDTISRIHRACILSGVKTELIIKKDANLGGKQ